jgi:hypothetical protein
MHADCEHHWGDVAQFVTVGASSLQTETAKRISAHDDTPRNASVDNVANLGCFCRKTPLYGGASESNLALPRRRRCGERVSSSLAQAALPS